MVWLLAQQIPGITPIAVLESRHWGTLRRAILVTASGPGEPVDRLLPVLGPAGQLDLAHAIGRFVARLHERGFRDGNLDLRNLLAKHEPDGWRLAKIDSPRYRLCHPGATEDRRTRRDWARLLPQLQPYGLAEAARIAARRPTPASPSPHPH